MGWMGPLDMDGPEIRPCLGFLFFGFFGGYDEIG
jgi:hypothetical protein